MTMITGAEDNQINRKQDIRASFGYGDETIEKQESGLARNLLVITLSPSQPVLVSIPTRPQ